MTPLGLLNLLETRLGLLRADAARAPQVTHYRECLTQRRYYHGSFAIDPIGASTSLLSWRDAWYLHGWNSALPPAAGARISDIASVETVSRELLFRSIGERLAKGSELLVRQHAKIKSIEFVDPFYAFPKRWREVLAKLPLSFVRAYAPPADAAKRAIAEFQRHVAIAAVNYVEPERVLAGKFSGGELGGVADLVVRNRSGRRALVDTKWSGINYHQDRLTKNRHLQLAVYGELLRQETGA